MRVTWNVIAFLSVYGTYVLRQKPAKDIKNIRYCAKYVFVYYIIHFFCTRRKGRKGGGEAGIALREMKKKNNNKMGIIKERKHREGAEVI